MTWSDYILDPFWVQSKRWTWGGGQIRTFHFVWEGDACELNNFGSCEEGGNTYEASQISLAARGVTAVPGTFPDYPVVQEPLGGRQLCPA